MNKEEIIKALTELRDKSFDMGMETEGASHEEAYYDGCFDAYGSALKIIQGELEEPVKEDN